MGKRQLLQRRGRGGAAFVSPSWRHMGRVSYPQVVAEEKTGSVEFIVKDIVHESGRGAPVVIAKNKEGVSSLMVAPEGTYVGQRIFYGVSAAINSGNVLPLKVIPEGTLICNIEGRVGDGGKFVRSAGGYATLVSHTPDSVLCMFPSGTIKAFASMCRATIGIVASGGLTEKPMLKAGANYHKWRARAHHYPTNRGKSMSPYAHPHGGGSHQRGSTPVGRNAPPGQKVGIIASRRTGRRKK